MPPLQEEPQHGVRPGLPGARIDGESQRAHRWRMLDESHGNGRTEARWNL